MTASDLLRSLNVAAWVLHGTLLFILVAWRVANANADTTAPVFAQDLAMGEDDTRWYNVGLRRTSASVELWGLTAFFTAVTSAAHFLYATRFRRSYEDNITRGVQGWRWIEYGLTATPMYIIISMLAGVRTWPTLAIVVACSIGTMLQGYVCETVLTKKHWDAAVASMATGWTLFLGNWILIAAEWYGGLQESRRAMRSVTRTEGETPSGPPESIEALIFVMMALFASFGAVALYRVVDCAYRTDAACDYVRVEIAYVTLSFATKFILAIWLMTTVFVEIPWLNQVCGCIGDSCIPGMLPG